MDATTVTECLHACGSSFCSAAAADAAETDSAVMDAETTAACGSSCSSSAAADSATTDADADLKIHQPNLKLMTPAPYGAGVFVYSAPAAMSGRIFLNIFLPVFTSGFFTLFSRAGIIHTILQHTVLINLVNRISVNDQFPCQFCSFLSLCFLNP